MSALGQKPTCAPQKVMSALHPIATAKADSAFAALSLASAMDQAINCNA